MDAAFFLEYISISVRFSCKRDGGSSNSCSNGYEKFRMEWRTLWAGSVLDRNRGKRNHPDRNFVLT